MSDPFTGLSDSVEDYFNRISRRTSRRAVRRYKTREAFKPKRFIAKSIRKADVQKEYRKALREKTMRKYTRKKKRIG